MNVTEILDAYSKLSFKEKTLFEQGYNRLKAEEKLNVIKKKQETIDRIKNITTDGNKPYFSEEFVKNKILKLK